MRSSDSGTRYVRRMDQEAQLELAQKHLIRYASAFVPFVISRPEV